MKSNELSNHLNDDQEEEKEEMTVSSKINSMMESVIPFDTYKDNLSIYAIRICMNDQIKTLSFLCGTESLIEDVGIQLWAGSLLLTDYVLHHKVVLIFPI